jgi:hypothetical protein
VGLQQISLLPLLARVGEVWIADNPDLRQITALGAEDIDVAGLRVERNPRLSATDALGWGTVSGDVIVCDDDLPSLELLRGITEIAGGLLVCSNPALAELSALATLERVEGDLVVVDNPALPRAEIEALLARIAVGGAVTVSGNGP